MCKNTYLKKFKIFLGVKKRKKIKMKCAFAYIPYETFKKEKKIDSSFKKIIRLYKKNMLKTCNQ